MRNGQEIERLPLTPFYETQIVPWGRVAILARWPVRNEDWDPEQEDSDAFVTTIQSRPNVEAMRLADYNHDGWATEFRLQLGAAPCGKRLAIVIGVAPGRTGLHAFGTAEHPKVPLVLHVEHWDALAHANGTTTGIEWECGDHGSDNEAVIELRTDSKGIHATRLEYACKEDGSRGALVSKVRL